MSKFAYTLNVGLAGFNLGVGTFVLVTNGGGLCSFAAATFCAFLAYVSRK